MIFEERAAMDTAREPGTVRRDLGVDISARKCTGRIDARLQNVIRKRRKRRRVRSTCDPPDGPRMLNRNVKRTPIAVRSSFCDCPFKEKQNAAFPSKSKSRSKTSRGLGRPTNVSDSVRWDVFHWRI